MSRHSHGLAIRALASALASLLFWTPLAPSVARAQQVELDRADQARFEEAAQYVDDTELAVELDEDVVEQGDYEQTQVEYESGNPADARSNGTLLALPGGDTRTSVSPQSISLPSAEGSVEGMGESFTPHLSSGTGSFSVPIAVAPGRAGVQPSFALAYSTSGGNGPVGFGWSLSAPFISRQVDRGVPRYDDRQRWHSAEDRFVYNGGQELVPVDSAAMARVDFSAENAGVVYPQGVSASWQEYRARVEGGFMRFFRAPDFQRWVVVSKDGSRFDFGAIAVGEGPSEMVAASTRSLEHDPEYQPPGRSDDPAPPRRVYRWMLTRMVDAHGSPLWYRYDQLEGNAYLRDVTYVSPQGPSGCTPGEPWTNAKCDAALDQYASRVAFEYENRDDVYDTWVSGWRTATSRRLARIVVTAWNDTLNERALVRRYHLSYRTGSFHSLLSSVQLEGRPDAVNEWGVRVLGAAVPERTLEPAVVGPTLPAMRFTYSEIPRSLDGTTREVASSPPHAVGEARSELFDVNSDGLPDLVVNDSRFRTPDGRPAAGVFFNGFDGDSAAPAGAAAHFSRAVRMPLPTGRDGVMQFSNSQIAPMDIDGDGRGDLLHMPRARTYGWFSPTRSAEGEGAASPSEQGWRWSYEEVELPSSDADPRIDLRSDGAHIEVLDLNNDHLIDVVRTAGTSIQAWLNLGWLEGGEGRFGSYRWSGDRAILSTEPIVSCLPAADGVFDFDDARSRLGDMNGDGLQDLVRIRAGQVLYWPGRGDGSFGIGARGCGAGIAGNRHIEMASAPTDVDIRQQDVYLADIDADGTSDIVQVRFEHIDVWMNRAGRGFAPRLTVGQTPQNPASLHDVRLVDIDGSGTVDVLYATAGGWRYVDLAGGQRPRLLTGVENGLGARTTLEYASSAEDYLRDLQACAEGDTGNCFTWDQPGDPGERTLTHRAGGTPVISTVVRAVTTTDRMDVYGLEPQQARQELYYHDGYYEGIEQEFRGFGVTDAWAIGDWNNPTTISRTWFHQGRRAQDIAADRLAYNPDEALKGREYLTETLDEEGRYLASAHATLAVRRLATGLDGRPIDYAYVTEANELRYDTTPFTPLNESLSLVDVVYQDVNPTTGAVTEIAGGRTRVASIRGDRAGRIRSTFDVVDNLGHVRQQTAHGQVDLRTAATIDEPIVSHVVPTAVALPHGITAWRTSETWVDGPSSTRLQWSRVTRFTVAGDAAVSSVQLLPTADGSPVSIPSLPFLGELEQGLANEGDAASYGTASEDIVTSMAFDAWGQPHAQCAGGDLGSAPAYSTLHPNCLRFGTIERDARFAQLPLAESAWVGSGPDDKLVTRGEWDRGLLLLLRAKAPNDESSRMLYDGFGRPVAAVPPPVDGCPDELPSTLIRHELTPNPELQPLSRVRTTSLIRTADSCAAAAPIEAIAYVDGLGRPRATLATGGDDHAWVRSGIATFDRKGSVRRTYQPDFYDGEENAFASVVALPGAIPYAVTRYDGFGRARGVIAEDGATVWTSHHALSTDVCDPLDNDVSSPHYRTCTTARADGHGRVIDQVLRNRDPDTGAEEHYRLWSWYRQDGAVLALARTQRDASVTRPAAIPTRNSTTVVRTFTYDSAGRRWISADPDTDSPSRDRTYRDRSWRYLFNRVGDLVAVRDPRGCGQNFFYDFGGRLLGEQYVSCAEAQPMRAEQPTAQLPAGVVGLGLTATTATVDVRYFYDDYSAPELEWSNGVRPDANDARAVGMPTGVMDRGQRSVVSYDRRGNAVWSARQMALISNTAELVVPTSPNDPPRRSENPAVGTLTYDELHTYVRTARFDHAARPVSMTLPTDPDYGPDAPVIGGSLTYDGRGLPETATAHVGSDAYPIVRSIRYARDGAVERTVWGDLRGPEATVSETRYDRRRRPIRFITTRDPSELAQPGELGAVRTVVDQELVWDAASNLTDIVDHRDGSEWPAGFRPRTTHVDHDSLYRVVGAFFEYTQEDNTRSTQDQSTDYRDTIDAIRLAGADAMATRPAEMLPTAAPERAVSLTWDWDFLANSTEWTDDADSFYERSIGRITNGLDVGLRPSALYFATNIDAPVATRQGNAGWVEVDYGEGGNVTAMTVRAQCGPVLADGVCTADSAPPAGTPPERARAFSLQASCDCRSEQHYEYRWDELNRLAEARRWDRGGSAAPTWQLKVRQRYRYDGSNQRTLKQTLDLSSGVEEPPGGAQERIALYVLPGDFERRGLVREALTYEPTPTGAETQYLVAGARLVWRNGGDPGLHENRRLTVPLSDVIQTTAATLDLISGDLLEASTYYPNGARETFRADTADPSAAEPEGFTGKEADEEVGVVYFGERYLIPRIGRWASPDPLHAHAAGGGVTLNAYHYVGGNTLQGRDPVGLVCGDNESCAAESATGAEEANLSLPDGQIAQREGETVDAPAEGTAVFSAAVERSIRARAAADRVVTYVPGPGEGSTPGEIETRMTGAVRMVGGAIEVGLGAAAASTPTGVGQVVGGLAIVHGADNVAAGATQAVTGEHRSSATEAAITEIARAAGAGDETAQMLGAGGDALIGAALSAGTSGMIAAEGEVAAAMARGPSVEPGPTNPVPARMARVVPAEFAGGARLAAPGATEAWVTAADDLAGITTSEGLASRLTLVDGNGALIPGPRAIIEFDAVTEGLRSPVLRDTPGFVGRGMTAGGAREFVIPNLRIDELQNVTIRVVQ